MNLLLDLRRICRSSVQDIESISEYLNLSENILSQLHHSIYERLGIPVPPNSIQQPLLRGDLRFLIDSYYRSGIELVASLNRDLPALARGTSLDLLDKIDQSIYQTAQLISGLTCQIHNFLEANLLDREILRYRFILAMSEAVTKGGDARTVYEAQNILERQRFW